MIDWQNPKYIDLPDLRMAVFEAGEKHDDMPSLVLCHGWPELAYSWRKVVPILVEAGLHVIVPEQRGYGMTGKALSDAGDESGVPLYDMAHLTGDLVHLLEPFLPAMIGAALLFGKCPSTTPTGRPV
jgi:pimeloyl-ACP methyl ester carboxylesterase